MVFFISFLSGIIAAFTPCVIVLMPILLYRFFHEKTKHWKNYAIFICGFLLSYILFGYFLSELFTSFIQNGLKVGLGLLFIILGILAIMKKLNPINFPIMKNSFLLGTIFALIVSLNPCTIPYLSFIVAIESKSYLFINLISFGLGLIIPSLLFAIFGKKILQITNKGKKIFSHVNNLMHIILILSGIYLITTIEKIEILDTYIISIFLILIFVIIMRAFFLINSRNDIFNLKKLLIIIALGIIIYTVIFSCSNFIENKNKIEKIFNVGEYQSPQSCSIQTQLCKVCLKCIYTFSIASIIGFLGLFLIRRRD